MGQAMSIRCEIYEGVGGHGIRTGEGTWIASDKGDWIITDWKHWNHLVHENAELTRVCKKQAAELMRLQSPELAKELKHNVQNP